MRGDIFFELWFVNAKKIDQTNGANPLTLFTPKGQICRACLIVSDCYVTGRRPGIVTIKNIFLWPEDIPQ